MEESTSAELTREIIETRKAIQQKCNLLKRNREETDEYLKLKYQPLLNSMERLVNKHGIVEHIPSSVHYEIQKQEEETPHIPLKMPKYSIKQLSPQDKTPKPRPLKIFNRRLEEVWEDSSFVKSEQDEQDDQPKTPLQEVREAVQTSQGEEMLQKYLKEVGNISSKYVIKLVNNDVKDLDTVYGIKYDGCKFTIGDTVISINEDVLTVGEDTYHGTQGLFELLFTKNPNLSLVNKSDYDNYKQILMQTNAHFEGHSPTGSMIQLKTYPKYNKVISKLFKIKKGTGVVDPNVLVKRLRDLIGSKKGKSEIRRIEEQLREGGIIV